MAPKVALLKKQDFFVRKAGGYSIPPSIENLERAEFMAPVVKKIVEYKINKSKFDYNKVQFDVLINDTVLNNTNIDDVSSPSSSIIFNKVSLSK